MTSAAVVALLLGPVSTAINGIFFLVVLAFLLGFRKTPTIDPAQARRILVDALPGFAVAELCVASDGRGALAAGDDGRVALIRPHGDRWVVRIVERARRDGSRVTLLPSEILTGATTLDLGAAAPVWSRRLAA